jgi:hypothetical protein
VTPYIVPAHDGETLENPSIDELRALAPRAPRGLIIFDYSFESLEPLAPFPALETLKIQTAGKLTSLDGLPVLAALRTLLIAPPPSWDGSSRRIEVESYAPIASLRRLESLSLLRVRPRDDDLSPIASMRHLKTLDLAGVPEFTVERLARLSLELPHTQGRCLRPYFTIEGVGFCARCRGQKVMLTGAPPRGRRWLCPRCDEKALAKHVRKWNEIARA